MTKKFSMLFTIVFSMMMLGSSAHADLTVAKQSTKTKGATTITWDSAFEDLDYNEGSPITMTVAWTVDEGAAGYHSFELKHFTPKSKNDPADGTVSSITPNVISVTVEFAFTDLHLDKKRNVKIGNAHFKLYLNIDKDGDGSYDSVAGYGVNVHVEDPFLP